MQFSQLTNRINGEGAAAWDLHEMAIKDAMAGKDVIVLSVGALITICSEEILW